MTRRRPWRPARAPRTQCWASTCCAPFSSHCAHSCSRHAPRRRCCLPQQARCTHGRAHAPRAAAQYLAPVASTPETVRLTCVALRLLATLIKEFPRTMRAHVPAALRATLGVLVHNVGAYEAVVGA